MSFKFSWISSRTIQKIIFAISNLSLSLYTWYFERFPSLVDLEVVTTISKWTEGNSPPCWSCLHVAVPLFSKKNVSTNNLRWKEWKNLLLRLLLVSSVHKHSIKTVRIRSYSGPHFSRIFRHSDWIRRFLVFFRLRKTSLQLVLMQISRRKVR